MEARPWPSTEFPGPPWISLRSEQAGLLKIADPAGCAGQWVTFQSAGGRDIEKMKRESGRPIDLADIALIREKRRMARRGR